MKVIKTTVSIVNAMDDSTQMAKDEIANLLNEENWNDPLAAPETFDELRRMVIEVMFISEIRVEKVEVVDNGDSSGTTFDFNFDDAGAPG